MTAELLSFKMTMHPTQRSEVSSKSLFTSFAKTGVICMQLFYKAHNNIMLYFPDGAEIFKINFKFMNEAWIYLV